METTYDDLFEEKEEKTDYHALLFKYLIRWPWFVTSVILCLAGAWLYLRYTTPVYNINASVIIKDDKKGGGTGSDLSAFEDMGFLSSSKNIDNEIEILRSKSLVKKVVNELKLYISYSTNGSFHDMELYGTSPISVQFSPEDASRLSDPILLTLNLLPGGGLDVNAIINEKTSSKHFSKLPAVLPTEAGTITFMPAPEQTDDNISIIDAVIVNPLEVAKSYVNALTIEPTSKTTSVATISFKNTDKKRGEDFVYKLIEMYNRDANNDKNEVAENTARFIDERIAVINHVIRDNRTGTGKL